LAVAAELKKQQKSVRIVYIGQRGDAFADIVSENENIDQTRLIFAGKFRRYHGEGWKQLLDIKTVFLNLRDVLYIVLGCLQSVWLIACLRPAVVFIKGGFIGVPVGLAAALWRRPYVTHDSDAIAGLANRIIARWARVHAVALPAELYMYPPEKTVTVGVPIASEFSRVDKKKQTAFKKAIGLEANEQLLFVTGGGLGAKVINDAMIVIANDLLKNYPSLRIIHTAGHKHKEAVAKAYTRKLSSKDLKRVTVADYLEDIYQYTGAADVVVARAGATNMAELAAQGKACVIIPNPVLAGGHQLKNAEAFAEAQAVKMIYQAELEANSDVLYESVAQLLSSPKLRTQLSQKLHVFAHADAAHKLAMILLKQAK